MMLFYELEDRNGTPLTAVIDINTMKGRRLDSGHHFTVSRFVLEERLEYKSARHFPREFFE